MKVRNIQQYIDIVTNGQLRTKIGGKDDPFLTQIAGRVENLEQYIADLPNFASDTATQIFYEFMQNAEDSGADSLYLFFDEGHFIVLNNGKPFYTDSSDKRGQLFEFLGKGKGNKSTIEGQIGEHGQGSKLLYDLLLPIQETSDLGPSSKAALAQAIIKELKGPILFSWNSQFNLAELFSWNGESISYDGNCEDLHYPLLTKLAMSYYPSTLGEVADLYDGKRKELFSQVELVSFVKYLNAVRSRVQWTDFTQGTILYIPIGVGQFEKLKKAWDEGLKQGLSTSMNFLEKLKYTYVNGSLIKSTGFKVIKLNTLKREKEEFGVQIAIPESPDLLDAESINFYKYFPIAKARYGLKYLINTKAYDIGAARQEIDIKKLGNEPVLREISNQIVAYLAHCREEDNRAEFIHFMRCILSKSDDLAGPEGVFFKEQFHDRLIKVLCENVPTERGFVNSSDLAKIKNTSLNIHPSDFGIEDWDWLDEGLLKDYKLIRQQLKIFDCTIVDLFEATLEDSYIHKWVSGLNDSEYLLLLQEIQQNVSDFDELKQIRCWRFSDSNIYTLEEVIQNTALLFLLPEMQLLQPYLIKSELIFGGWGLDQLEKMRGLINKSDSLGPANLWSRISIALSSVDFSDRDDKWAIFGVFNSDKIGRLYLEDDLFLFKNQMGVKKPLNLLSNETTNWAPSGILREYSILASEFIPELSSHFIKKEEVWNHLVKKWHLVEKHLMEGPESYPNKLADLDRVFSFDEDNQAISEGAKWIFVVDKVLSSSEVYCHEKLKNLNKEQYKEFEDFLEANTNLSLPDATLISAILDVKFAKLPESGLQAIENHFESEEVIIHKMMLEVFNKVKKDNEGFFQHFKLKKNELNDEITLEIRESAEIQYYSEDQSLIQFINDHKHYFLLPKELKSVFLEDKALKVEPSDDNFVTDLIEKFGAIPPFIDIVSKRQDIRLKELFITKLKSIDLASGDTPNSYVDTFESKVIKMITGVNDWIPRFKHKIKIDGRPIDEFNYNEYISIGEFSAKFELSKLLPELGDHSSRLASIKSKLHNSGFQKLLTNKDFSILDIINKIKTPNAYQLAFILVANKYGEKTQNWYSSKYILLESEQPNALDQFYQLNFTFFSDFKFPEKWFNLKSYILTERYDLLLNHEIVPDWIIEWMGNDSNKKQFLEAAGLRTSAHSILKFRSAFDSNSYFNESDFPNAFRREGTDLTDTLRWIKDNFEFPALHSNREINLRKLLDYFWETTKKLPDELPFLRLDEEGNRIQVKMEIPNWTKVRYVESIARRGG